MPEQTEIFISYAWGTAASEKETVADEIENSLKNRGLNVVRDKTGGLGYKGNIKGFMQQIGQGKIVICIISDKYLRSKNCMFELFEIAKNDNFYDRIFPVVLSDAQIYDALDLLGYVNYWDEKIKALNQAMKASESQANLHGIRDDLDLYTEIRAQILKIVDTLRNMNALTPEMHQQSGYEELYSAIQEKLQEDQKQEAQRETLGEIRYQTLTDNRKFFCDRSVQEGDFIEYLSSSSSRHFQFYLIHGEEMQAHESLVKRFAIDRLGVEPLHDRDFLVLKEAKSENAYRLLIRETLFKKYLGADLRSYRTEELNINLLAQHLMEEDAAKVCFVFRVESSRWKPFTPSLLNWFTSEFCDEKQLPENAPTFYFFLNVVYAEDIKPLSVWDKLRGKKDRKQKIIEGFNKLRDKKPLSELEMVQRQDVEDWISEYMTVNDRTKNSIYEHYFGDTKTGFFMDDVEEKLGQLIEDFNSQSEELAKIGVKFVRKT